MKIAYCDHGALTPNLKKLREQKRIEIVTFPYDDRCKKICIAQPSKAKIQDLHMSFQEAPGAFGDYTESAKFIEIERTLGKENSRDVLHVDSAFKSKCTYFFSMDKKHILANRVELQSIIGIKFFHPVIEWNDFLKDFQAENVAQ